MDWEDTVKHPIKIVRWRLRRLRTGMRYSMPELQRMPVVLGNAMPKSGSHLIIQLLQGLTRIGPFVNPGFPPVNRSEGNRKLPDETVLENIRRMEPGDIGYGYISARQPFIDALTCPGRATIFVYRDPRDMIISHIFYATDLHADHWMHRYYTENLSTMEERINAAITGVQEPGSELTPIRQRYDGYLGWLDQQEVLALRFENLILEQEDAIPQILAFLEKGGFTPHLPGNEAVRILQQAVQPQKSGTFRKSRPGNWREYFTQTNKEIFKDQTGDLLIRLGYEQDDCW